MTGFDEWAAKYRSPQGAATPQGAMRSTDAAAQGGSFDEWAASMRGQTAPATPTAAPRYGAFGQGVQEAIGGALQTIVRAGAALAPNSQFAKDARGPGGLAALDRQIEQNRAQYDAAREERGDTGIDWGRVGGNVVGGLPFALGGGPAKTLLGRAATGGLAGAASAVSSPVAGAQTDGDFWAEKGKQAVGGALTGSVVSGVLGPLVGGLARGVKNDAARRLADAGIKLTPGQILGGAWRAAEDKLTSVPLVGDLIRDRQRASFGSFNRAAYNRALSPIGQTADASIPVGSDSVAAVRNKIGDVYDAATPQALFAPDKPFMTQFQGIRNTLSQAAPSRLGQFDTIADQQLFQKMNGPTMSGPHWANSRSEIGGFARKSRGGNASPDDLNFADALTDLNEAMAQSVARFSPPGVAQQIGNANAAWAQYKQLEKAAGSVGSVNNGNVFTPAQYSSAVRSGSTNGQRATNSGLNGQFASDATQTIGNTYPDSGTAGRMLIGALAGGGAGFFNPYTLAATVPLTMAYTPIGRSALQTMLLGNRPGFIAKPGGLMAQIMGERGGLFASPLADPTAQALPWDRRASEDELLFGH